jgi:chromosome segregation ATPase
MQKLREKETILKDRKQKLESSLQELKEKINAENLEQITREIHSKAGEVQKLEGEIELTELAIQHAQEKLREREKFEASKEYKDKRKMQEKLYSEAGEQAEKHFEKLSSLVGEIEETFNQVEQADRILAELAENKTEVYWSFKQRVEPYARLRKIQTFLKNELADRAYRTRKAQEILKRAQETK